MFHHAQVLLSDLLERHQDLGRLDGPRLLLLGLVHLGTLFHEWIVIGESFLTLLAAVNLEIFAILFVLI